MPDDMDRAQDFNAMHVSDALARHAQRRPRRPGLAHCETLDCGEPIDPARTRLGARLCIDCSEEDRLRAAQYARGAGC